MAGRSGARWAAIVVVELLVCAPVAFIVTILMSPFWGWYEARTGIESLGHSGPSDWCFELTYVVVVVIALVVTVTAFARQRSES
jgi:uncharacterized Tic20 family protein